MIILTNSGQSLQIVLSGNVSQNPLPFACSYVDLGNVNFVGGLTDGSTTNTTPVTIIPNPTTEPIQRQLKFISVYNTDVVTQIVTVQLNDNGNILNIFTAYLGVGYTLIYNNDKGFVVYNNYGIMADNENLGVPYTFTLSCADGIWQPAPTNSYVFGTRYGIQPALVSSMYLPSFYVPSSLMGNYFGFYMPSAATIKSVSLNAGYLNTAGANVSANVSFTKNNTTTYLVDGNVNFSTINYSSNNALNVQCGQGDYINGMIQFGGSTPPTGFFLTLLFYCN